MRRMIGILSLIGAAAVLGGPASASSIFTFDVTIAAPLGPIAAGDNGPHGVYAPSLTTVSIPGTPIASTTYDLIPNSTLGLGIFGELDASPPGADIVMAFPQLTSSSTSASSFDFFYSFDVKVFADDNPLDFGDFFVNGHVTGSGVKKGQATTTQTYLSTVPQTLTTALSGSVFNLTRLQFTFPQAPPVGGGPGTIGAFSAHVVGVPEPGPLALLTGACVVGSALKLRRRRTC